MIFFSNQEQIFKKFKSQDNFAKWDSCHTWIPTPIIIMTVNHPFPIILAIWGGRGGRAGKQHTFSTALFNQDLDCWVVCILKLQLKTKLDDFWYEAFPRTIFSPFLPHRQLRRSTMSSWDFKSPLRVLQLHIFAPQYQMPPVNYIPP